MQLTKAEEQVMQYLWKMGEGSVQDVRECFPAPMPSRTTVSTVIRILEAKGFVDHKAGGRVFTYFPAVRKETFLKHQLSDILKNYFNNSFASLASFFAKESKMSIREMELLLEDTRNELKKKSGESTEQKDKMT
jgi:predicted transcriptional regulator